MDRVYFIGIAGGSCSGKTTLARALERRLGDTDVACVSIDSYYHGLASRSLEEIDAYNFDNPDALDHALLIGQLRELAAGRAVQIPVYDFTTHRRTSRTARVVPEPFIIVEGLFPFYWETVRNLMNTRVFVDASPDVCLERRLERDTVERARPREEVIRRFNTMSRPMYEKHVLPGREYADVVIDGTRPIEESVNVVLRHIEATRARRRRGAR
jgi:uridine kinase